MEKKERELKELQAIKANYDIVASSMNAVIENVLKDYSYYQNKEDLNEYINFLQDISNKAVTASNNILIKILSK